MRSIILADFNGDGLVDMAAPVNSDNVVDTGDWQVCLSTGDGSFARFVAPQTRTSTCTTVPGMLYAPSKNVVAGDFDGDGRSDLLAYYDANGCAWQIAYARGASGKYASSDPPVSFEHRDLTSSRSPDGSDAELSRSARVGNFYGIGVSSISMREGVNGAHGLYTPFDASGKPITQELITRITDGLGAVTEIDYAPLTDPSVYGATPPLGFATALATGEINVQAPMFVVKETRADNGLAECSVGGSGCNWHRLQYQYYGLRGTANGRGLLGFAQRDVTEVFGSTACTRVRTTYNNALAQWWQAGSPRQVIKEHLDAGGTASVLTQTTFSYGAPNAHVVTPTIGGSTYTYYEAYPPATLTESWDLNGARLPTQSSVVNGYDQDGNPLTVTVTTDDGIEQVSKVSRNTYGFRSVTDATSSGPGRWVLGRLTGASVTHTRSGQASVVRTSGFTYHGDGVNSCWERGLTAPVGYVCDEIIEPNASTGADPTLWSSTRNYYDGTGNKIASTVNYMALAQGDGGGYVAASRSGGRTQYDASGTFPVTLTNALGHVEQRSYDARFGVAADVIGPNGLLTRSDVDNFGRVIRSRSFAGATSGSATVTDSATQSGNCPATDPIYGQGCQANEAYWRLTRSAGGAATISYYDRLEREVRVVSQAYLDSSAATNASANQWRSASAAFDGHGRKAQVSKPAGDGTATTTYNYDDLDRPIQETLTGGSLNAVTVTVYNGQSTTVTRQRAASDLADRTDQSSTRTVDVQGQSKQITDALNGSTQYVYDAVGNLTSLTAPGGLTETMGYDLRGRKIALASPQAGSYTYRYNGIGELQRQTDGRGWVTVNVYDALGRPQWREEREGATSSSPKIVTQWDYDGGAECGSRTIGKLCAVQTSKLNYSVGNGASTRSHYQYDSAGRA